MTSPGSFRPALTVLLLSAVALSGCDRRRTDPADTPTTGPSSHAPKSSAAPLLSIKSETRQFKDWRASCGNDGTCWAFGFAPEFEAGWVRIKMEAGPAARPQLMFGYWPDSAVTPTDEISLEVDGVNYQGTPTSDSDPEQPISSVQNSAGLIDAMARGRSMFIHGSSVRVISLSGASAAMLWIDEKQQRLGTQAALIRRGDRPASDVPAAPVLPVVAIAPPTDQTGMDAEGETLPAALRNRPEVRACLEDSVQPDVSKTGMAFRLDAQTELYAVPCGSGAYNLTHYWYLTGRAGQNPRPAALVGTAGPGADPAWADQATINGEYDPKTRRLLSFARGRGLGDCGTIQSWAWIGDTFALIEERSMGDCAGVPADLWPITWRTR